VLNPSSSAQIRWSPPDDWRDWRTVSEDTRAVASDDLPARLIKPHTLEKFDYHDRYCEIVAVGSTATESGSEGSARYRPRASSFWSYHSGE